MEKLVQTPLLHFQEVHFAYQRKGTPILQNIQLKIEAGERVGIIGGNGSGKSTLGKLLLGILKPQSGRIRLLGKPVHWNEHFPALGYIGDPGHNAEELGLPTQRTVGSVIDTIQRLETAQANTPESLHLLKEALGLHALETRRIEVLSTGERKRLMACLTFMRNPKFILLDEPLDGLDESVATYIRARIAALAEQPDLTLVYIAHDRVEIDSFTNKVFRLHKGRLEPEPQHWFEGKIRFTQSNEKDLVFREKTGQVIGRLQQIMHDSKGSNGFELSIQPGQP